jgi:ribosomal protein S18 acetylase RimI-like enzyme
MKQNFKDYLFSTRIDTVDWQQMKDLLQADQFDNGRTAEQLYLSFKNSYGQVIVFDQDLIIGTARVLSDGIGNAYLVDVWTYTPYRKQGIATEMIRLLESQLPGQHIYLQTDEISFYERLGYDEQPTGMSKTIGTYLKNS